MISKAIDVSITNISLKKLRLYQGWYKWYDTQGLISNDGPTIIYPLFKINNPYKRIGVYNLKYDAKATIDKFGNNLKDLLDDMSSN